MLKIINYHRRPLIFATSVAFALLLIQNFWNQANDEAAIWTILGSTVLIFLESLALKIKGNAILKQMNLPDVDTYSPVSENIIHLLLPLIYFLSVSGVAYLLSITSLEPLFTILAFVSFLTLFINIEAYYQGKHKLAIATDFVIDWEKLFIYFAVTFSILEAVNIFDFAFYVAMILLFVSACLLTLLIFIHIDYLDIFNMFLILISGVALAYLTLTISFQFSLFNIVTAFFSSLMFYIVNGLLFHEIKRTLTVKIVIEYLLVAIISLVTILFLS